MRVENSFIPVEGVGEKTERKLWRAGVTEWSAFDPSVVGPTTADRIESFLTEARTRLDDGDADYFDRTFPNGEQWRLYETFREDACFFDIETTGLDEYRDRVTTVTFHHAGDTTTLVRGRDLTADRLREQLREPSLLVTYNGKRFDVPFLERSFDLSIDRPHLDLIYPCRRAGLSGGLSAVESALGIGRENPDVSGRDAVRLWHEYEAGDDASLETLVEYNREDTVNLRTVADRVADRLHRSVFEPAVPD